VLNNGMTIRELFQDEGHSQDEVYSDDDISWCDMDEDEDTEHDEVILGDVQVRACKGVSVVLQWSLFRV
jgi:hypothetical protein